MSPAKSKLWGGISIDITDRKEAEEALRSRTQQLDAVRTVSEEITRELDLPTLLDLILRREVELVGAPAGGIFLWDDAAQLLTPAVWSGYEEGGVADKRLRLGEGLVGLVGQERQGRIVSDYRNWPGATQRFLAHTPITAAIAEPLLYRDRLVGVIALDDGGTGRLFTADDQNLLRLLAPQAAIAIQNARHYQEIRDHAATLEQRVAQRTAELAAANQQLQAASRLKSEFLANMSHELRTPLNSVIGFAEVLRERSAGPLTEKQARYLGHIHQAGKHLLALIGDILDLAKVEAGKIELQPEILPVASTLEDLLVIARGLAYKKGQTIETAISPDLPPLHADAVRFKQILFNLLSNAVKFTPNGGTITVRAHQQAGGSEQEAENSHQKPEGGMQGGGELPGLSSLVIAVTDTGIGIKAEDLPKLFQEFVQLERTHKERQEGTGLGLALTKRLVELHGGRIWAVSPGEGQGATFTVLLPFSRPIDTGTEGQGEKGTKG